MRTAAYARYSSDNQREASLDDQLRNCRGYCERHDWPEPVPYTDAEISGARNDRASYLRLLADLHKYDVLLVDDLTRFGRDKDEIGKNVKRMVFAGVRLIGVSDGIDTDRKGHKVEVGLRGLMAELYLDDLAEKTHRGLTGRALTGASAGGLPYGYRVTEVGQRMIDEAQAVVVRRIYAEYLAGRTPRAIVSALNGDAVPSARGGQWYVTAVYGDVRRGIGILANPIYVGRQVWNRSHWTKHPDTGRRIRRERPESEWIITEHPELAIVDRGTWDAVQASIRRRQLKRVDVGPHAGPGRPPRHLLSGLLRCASCGGPMVVVDRYRYGCNARKDRGEAACASPMRVPRAAVEEALLHSIRQDLLSEEAFRVYQRAVTDALKHATPDTTAVKRRLAAAEQMQRNIMAALRAGIITPSTKSELLNAERGVLELRAELQATEAYQPSQILPRARARWRGIVERLAEIRDVPAAREAIRDLLGEHITITQHENGDLYAEIAGMKSEINMVAGAGFGLYLTESVRIPITKLPGREE
jgi:DNA invertase Pin-like site-specific DNA recombinase